VTCSKPKKKNFASINSFDSLDYIEEIWNFLSSFQGVISFTIFLKLHAIYTNSTCCGWMFKAFSKYSFWGWFGEGKLRICESSRALAKFEPQPSMDISEGDDGDSPWWRKTCWYWHV